MESRPRSGWKERVFLAANCGGGTAGPHDSPLSAFTDRGIAEVQSCEVLASANNQAEALPSYGANQASANDFWQVVDVGRDRS